MRRAEPVEKALHPERVGVREGARVAHVPGHARRRDAPQPRRDVAERDLPGHSLELAAAAATQRMQDAVWIVLHLDHRDPLRAGVAA